MVQKPHSGHQGAHNGPDDRRDYECPLRHADHSPLRIAISFPTAIGLLTALIWFAA